jgi:Flp pilus assembly protein CpaB
VKDLARTVRRYRGLLAGGLAAGAVAVALPTLAPDPPPTLEAVTAARDLGPGLRLTRADLMVVALPRSLAPQGILTTIAAAVGHSVASRVRRGEPLTDVRLLGAGLVGDDGLVAAPVRLADSAAAALLHAGDRVNVLGTPSDARGSTVATTLAQDLQVLAVPAPDDSEGALVVLAATPDVAARLAGAAVASRLSITVLAS